MPAQIPEKPDLREIVFKESEKFSSEFVNGVYGGVGNNGMIAVSFFRDKALLPDKIQVEVKNDKVIRETKRIGGNYTRRDVFFEAILDIPTTKLMVDWFLSRIAEYEKLKNNEQSNDTISSPI